MADYYSVIASAVSRLPSKTDEARQAIYERARTALRETLRNYDPPLSETELANEEAALDAAIGTVEVDFLFAEMRHGARAAPSPPSLSFISKVKGFVRWAWEKLDTEWLAQASAFAQRTQLKAKDIGGRISSLTKRRI
jgi:hypothetical protein